MLGGRFLALGVAFNRLAPALKRLNRHLRTIEIETGRLLVVIGVVTRSNWLLAIDT